MWYQVFENHLNTNNHVRSLWGADLAKAPKHGGEAEKVWKAYVESWDSVLVEQGLWPSGDDALRPALPAAAAVAASWAPALGLRKAKATAKSSTTKALTKVREPEARQTPPLEERRSRWATSSSCPWTACSSPTTTSPRRGVGGFSDGRTFEDLIRDLQSGKVHPKRDNFLVLDVAYAEAERKAFSFNNRRLKCLKDSFAAFPSTLLQGA
ncbi:unnamed protein product [Prorocentrum cordatum]|nr:unnamed protein product [Polarella glacialis]